ncbi:uncharacterized protein LOC111449050 [Cucurbita moschata]|uniref:Uncharacterized protein LOC111449050 n=1 Tax=Cucurbita moschata TaxID=3662 RepID=A0A6J1FV08_CUCMO|nr:uncharacterized protein LOC111449050 [Cucurbita moschata]
MEDHRKQNAERLRKKSNKISLEDYLDFFSSDKQLFLPVAYLNQIIRMHGYMNIKGLKNVVKDAVGTINLVNLSRSTLKESISSSASITLEDVISDLKNLEWQECSVTSVLNFSSWKQNNSDTSPDRQEPTSASKKSGKKLRVLSERYSQEVEEIDGVSSSCASKKPGSESQSKRKKTAA